MSNSNPAISTDNASNITELNPSYAIPTVIIVGALPIFLIQPIVAGAIALFGLFLFYQAATIRLVFTETDLEVYRSQEKFRTFPYQEWQNWQIFWFEFPVLFYFKEIKSIHFLPILFDVQSLKSCLEKYIPDTSTSAQ
jgi:hypothetical protein